MTTQAPKVPGLDADQQAALEANLAQLDAKTPRNSLRAGLYDGKHAVKQLGGVIPPIYYQTAVVLGWPAKAVDLLARRVTMESLAWADGDIDALMPHGDMRALRSQVKQGTISSLLHSTAFLIAARDAQGTPRSYVRDALSATAIHDEATQALTSGLTVSRWGQGRALEAFTLYLPGVVVTADRRDGAWRVAHSEHGYGLPIEPLTYKARVGRPFGSSRISRPVISHYRQAVKTAVRMEAGADIYTLPQMILLGAGDEAFKNADGSYKPAWQVALGRVFALGDDDDAVTPRAEVHRFEGSSPEPSLKMLRQHAELFSGETSIPLTSLGVSTDGNPTSAESYMASREDLISEAEDVADENEGPLARHAARLLAMRAGERAIPEAYTSIRPQWRSPVYTSRAAAADAGAKQVSAVPWLAETSVGLELLGLTADQIDRAKAERRRAAGRDLAASLAQAAGRDQQG